VLARLAELQQLVVNGPWAGMAAQLRQLRQLTCLAFHTEADRQEMDAVVEAAVQLPQLHRLALGRAWPAAVARRVQEALPGCELHVVASDELLFPVDKV
jgi:hypothetical protein